MPNGRTRGRWGVWIPEDARADLTKDPLSHGILDHVQETTFLAIGTHYVLCRSHYVDLGN